MKKLNLVPLMISLASLCGCDEKIEFKINFSSTQSELIRLTEQVSDLKCREEFALDFGYKFEEQRLSYLGHKDIKPYLKDNNDKISCLELSGYLHSIK